MKHELKTWPIFFEQILIGTKTCEYRNDDRNFVVADTLVLQEYDPTENSYTGREIGAIVTHVVRTQDYIEFPLGYCMMSIKVVNLTF